MAKKLKQRIIDSFPEGDREGAKQYLDWIRSALTDVSANLRRSVMLMILLMAVFEFIIQSRRSSFTLAGFSVAEGSIVLKFIPALVAYLYLQSFVYSHRAAVLRDAFADTLARWSPEAEKNDLGFLLRPVHTLFWSEGWPTSEENRLRIDEVERRTSFVFMAIIMIGSLIFLTQAYYVLFPDRALANYVLWSTSLSITLYCLVATLWYISSFERY
jgi:hypothetical protein